MIHFEIVDFHQALGGPTRLAGLDLGTKTIGIALCDDTWRYATPAETIKRTKFTADAASLLSLFETQQVGGVVIGLPLNMDGTAGPRVQATKAFAANLAKQTELPITFWDERLSTVAAERVMLEADMSRKKRAGKIDAAAAAHILQGAIDRLANISNLDR